MKTPITVRIDPELLIAARRCAVQENRTLTNLIETVLKHWIDERAPLDASAQAVRDQTKASERP